MSETPLATPKKPRRILGFEISRVPRRGGRGRSYFHVWVSAVLGLLVVVGHEVIYRQTGGDDFELNETISHAGADMFLFTVLPIVAVLMLIEAGRIR